jgi:hypothetical protein
VLIRRTRLEEGIAQPDGRAEERAQS